MRCLIVALAFALSLAGFTVPASANAVPAFTLAVAPTDYRERIVTMGIEFRIDKLTSIIDRLTFRIDRLENLLQRPNLNPDRRDLFERRLARLESRKASLEIRLDRFEDLLAKVPDVAKRRLIRLYYRFGGGPISPF
jgi:hypothetical protein